MIWCERAQRQVPAARGEWLGDTGLCVGAERGHLSGAPGPFAVSGARPEGGTAALPAPLPASVAGGSGGASRGGFDLWGRGCSFSARAKRDLAEAVVTQWPAGRFPPRRQQPPTRTFCGCPVRTGCRQPRAGPAVPSGLAAELVGNAGLGAPGTIVPLVPTVQ